MKNTAGMAGYTKLFNSILASTIWREDHTTRIVWITLLAMANKDGIAEGSIPGLSDMARVSIDECKAALVKLESPDEYSRTKEHEGRRIEPCDGGWKLLNHAKYRAKMSADERREYNRLKQQEWRSKNTPSKNVNTQSSPVNDNQSQLPKSTLSAHTEAEAEAEAKAEVPPYPGDGRGIDIPKIKETQSYHKDARTVLHLLNEGAESKFREVDSNLKFISARLKEPGVDLAGVRLMIARQCKRWKGTSQAEYLRPETLFNQTKFDGYYAARELPVIDTHENSKRTATENPRNATTCPPPPGQISTADFVKRQQDRRDARDAERARIAVPQHPLATQVAPAGGQSSAGAKSC